MLPALADSPGHVVWRAAARVTSALADTLPPGVDIHAYAVLVALADEPPRSQQWLADAVATSRTTLTRVAGQLVADGLVERVRNADDRRAYALTRTPAGATAMTSWARHVAVVEDSLVAGLTDAERVELHSLLVAQVGQDLAEETPTPLLASTAFLVTRLHARLHAEVAADLGELDVEPRHLGTFLVLRRTGPVAQAELARHLGISGPSVVEIVDQLERRGALERRRSTTDRRTQLLHLLPLGEELLPTVHGRADAAADRVLGRLSAGQRDRLRRLLVRVVTGGSPSGSPSGS
nr:MarR family transcriptional regulator [Nocardioides lijunqiniae]